ncbi:MAG: orotate phosphoribosyltransferase [bacterium JZ-2024 1]
MELEHLKDIIRRRCVLVNTEQEFVLASGKRTPIYINLKALTMDPEGLHLIGEVVFRRILPLNPDGVGGLTMGADPIAYAVAMKSHEYKNPVLPFIIRKEPKLHGTGKWIEGNLPPNARVVIVEDVVTTGNSALRAAHIAQENGLQVIKILSIVDREEGAQASFLAHSFSYDFLFRLSDLM